jgi:HTH-type transcriptional regulator/antitoxin HipB
MRQIITQSDQVGAIVRARRKARRISQAEIAATLGVSQSRVSTLESDPSGLPLDRLILLAKLLGLELVLQDGTAPPRSKAEW